MTTTTAAKPGFWRRYGALWAAVPREFAAIIALFAIAYAGFAAGWAVFATGIGLVPVFLVGVFVVIGALYGARWFGWLDLTLIEWSGRPRIPRPAWPHRQGFFPWLRSMFGSAHYWLYLVYVLLPQLALAVVTFTVTITAVSVAFGGTFGWLFMLLAPHGPAEGFGWNTFGHGSAWPVEPVLPGSTVYGTVIRTVIGLGVAFALPFILRRATWAHWGLPRLMLGAFRSEALEQELAGAEASRAAAVAAEDTALRRLERDIHDGPQQRLIRLQMDLASADRRIDEAPAEARDLIASAAEQAREALDELRALSRGFAPPILLDRGLVAALESAATSSAVPVDIVNGVPAGVELPPEIERNAYFIASEGLTNAVKHSGAKRIGIAVTLDAAGRGVTITVSDDGRGGAVPIAGHGLAGLDERIHGLGGTLVVDSPQDGPTVLTAHLPW